MTKTDWLSQTKKMYYILYALIIVLFGVIWFLNYDSLKQTGEPYKLIEPQSTAGMVLQYAAIVYTLLSIPGALYGFKRVCTKLAKMEDEDLKYDTYYAYANLRMSLVALAAGLPLIVYMLLGAYKPMIWLAAIGAVALVFTKPSAAKTEEELRPQDNDLKY
ncbi:MAG: hypothetical protein IJT12_00620 [Paludibacteraceae bacterium]|nr:hypothetical protein [Paludibacteraceae bacterium]